MLNHIVIAGRMTRDPELRYTQGGVPVCSFTLAVERDLKDLSTGEKKTDFVDVVAWRSTADIVSKHASKGSMLAVSGRLQFRTWVDGDGNNRKAPEISAERVYFMGDKRERDNVKNAQQPVTESEPDFTEIDEDDIPF